MKQKKKEPSELEENFEEFEDLERDEEEDEEVAEEEEDVSEEEPQQGKPQRGRPQESEPQEEEIFEAKTQIDALDLAPDVPVQVVAVMAKKSISMKDLMGFHMGQVIDLNRPPNESVDLVANGKLVARGELVEIDGKLGVKIVKLVR